MTIEFETALTEIVKFVDDLEEYEFVSPEFEKEWDVEKDGHLLAGTLCNSCDLMTDGGDELVDRFDNSVQRLLSGDDWKADNFVREDIDFRYLARFEVSLSD